MSYNELPKLYWWRVEVSLGHAIVSTMVKARDEDHARAEACRQHGVTGQRPLACSNLFRLGPAL